MFSVFMHNNNRTWFFNALTFARSLGRCWKPRPSASVFNTSQGTWWMLMHEKPGLIPIVIVFCDTLIKLYDLVKRPRKCQNHETQPSRDNEGRWNKNILLLLHVESSMNMCIFFLFFFFFFFFLLLLSQLTFTRNRDQILCFYSSSLFRNGLVFKKASMEPQKSSPLSKLAEIVSSVVYPSLSIDSHRPEARSVWQPNYRRDIRKDTNGYWWKKKTKKKNSKL